MKSVITDLKRVGKIEEKVKILKESSNKRRRKEREQEVEEGGPGSGKKGDKGQDVRQDPNFVRAKTQGKSDEEAKAIAVKALVGNEGGPGSGQKGHTTADKDGDKDATKAADIKNAEDSISKIDKQIDRFAGELTQMAKDAKKSGAPDTPELEEDRKQLIGIITELQKSRGFAEDRLFKLNGGKK